MSTNLPPEEQPVPQAALAPGEPTMEELETFVGPNASYYLRVWKPALEGYGAPSTFNVAAFLILGLWLPYRKMYRTTLLCYGFFLVESLLEEALFRWVLGMPEVPYRFSLVIGLVIAVIFGAIGNRLYYSHARRVLGEVRDLNLPAQEHADELRRRGGTSMAMALLCFLAYLGIALGLFFVWNGVEDYQRYGHRLEINGGTVLYKPPVTEADARRLGEYLVRIRLFDGKDMAMQVLRDKGTVQLRVIYQPKDANDPEIVNYYKGLCASASREVFAGMPVEVHFCDEQMKTFKVVQPNADQIDRGQAQRLQVNGCTVEYKGSVTKAEAQRLGEYLVEIGFFRRPGAGVQLLHAKDTFQLRMIYPADQLKDQEFIDHCKKLCGELSREVFAGKTVEVHICNDQLETIRVIQGFKANEEPQLGHELEFNGNILYYQQPVTQAEARRLGEYLVKTGAFETPRGAVQLRRTKDTYEFRVIFSPENAAKPEWIAYHAGLCGQLSREMFDGKPVEVHCCDKQYQTHKVIRTDSAPAEDRNGRRLQVNGGTLQYKAPVTEAEAKKLGEYLVRCKLFDGRNTWLQVSRVKDVYQLRVIYKPDQLKDPKLVDYYQTMCGFISHEVFHDQAVEFHLCDNDLRSWKVLHGTWAGSKAKHFKEVEVNGGAVQYQEPVTEAEALDLGNYLAQIGLFDGTPTGLQLLRTKDGFQIKLIFDKGEWDNPQQIEYYQWLSGSLSQEVFEGQPVEIHFLDMQHQTRRVIKEE